jgi:hypothetical protein
MIRRLVDNNSALMCVLILIGLAFAGLWSVRPSKNDVYWLGTENGIRLLGDGTVVTDGLISSGNSATTGCSIELWLQHLNNFGESTILDFYQPNPPAEMKILQNGNSKLLLAKSDLSGQHAIELAYPFVKGLRTLITVTADNESAVVYLDAKAATTANEFTTSARDCAGRLVLGNAATHWANWNGDLLGVAVYKEKLTQSQVLRHYEAWSTNRNLEVNLSENPVAHYTFSERSGTIVHNDVTGEPNLFIPTVFQIPYPPFLELPWKEIGSGGFVWKDIAINIAGFIPFGFFLFAFLYSSRYSSRAGLMTISAGALVSLTIEILQWYLPSRTSSMTDVINNVIGTYLGAASYRTLFGIKPVKKPLPSGFQQ